MYLVLNSTDAARLQNRSALPDSPVVAQLARTARRDLLADDEQKWTRYDMEVAVREELAELRKLASSSASLQR